MSITKNLFYPLEGCMLFRDEGDEPLEQFSVEEALADPLEECMLFRDENDESLDVLGKSPLVDKSNEQCMEISTVKEERVDLLEDGCQLIVRKTYERCHKKITIAEKQPVDLLEEKYLLNTDKTGEIFQKYSNNSNKKYQLITDIGGDEHHAEVKIKKEPIDILEDKYQLSLDENNDCPHEITMTKNEPDDLNLAKLCSTTGQNYEGSSNSTVTKKGLNDIQSVAIKTESFVPFEECLLIDNSQQYCLLGGSDIKQESVDPFEECLDMKKTTLNYASLTTSMGEKSVERIGGIIVRKPYIKVKSPNLLFAAIKEDSKEETGKPVDGRIVRKPYIKVKSPNFLLAADTEDSKEETGVSSNMNLMETRKQLPNFQGSLSPFITKNKKDIQVLRDQKLQHIRFDSGLFHDPPEHIHEHSNIYLNCIPKKRIPKINMNHSCKTTVLCPECNHCFPNIVCLRRHLLYNHGLKDVHRYYCCKCKELFQNIYGLMNHMTKESGQILVYCCFCNGSFVIRKHAGKFLYRTSFYVKRERCKFCLRMFASVEFLKRHVCDNGVIVKYKY